MRLTDEITSIKGIGDKTAGLFHKLNIYHVKDLLLHFPRDYDELKEPVSIAECISSCNNPGKADVIHAIKATIVKSVVTKRVGRLSISSFTVQDETGSMDITFFNMPYLSKTLLAGRKYVFRGFPIRKGLHFYFEHPQMYKVEEYQKICGLLHPVYPTTAGLSQKTIIKAIQTVLQEVSDMEDYLPSSIRTKMHFPSYHEALSTLHFPNSKEAYICARARFVFEEFFMFILSVKALKQWNENQKSDYPYHECAEPDQLLEKLPYSLTNAQLRVWNEIQEDLTSDHLMNRLVQGDVGSGKTIVAILAILMSVGNGRQSAFMAPTEVLAKQHYESLMQMKEDYELSINPVLLVGSLTAKQKREAYEKIANGEVNIIVGTSALIQEKVIYHNLSLVITDEQHRFGVKQRETLAQKGIQAHVLVMSATPIPRTLALILYGDLDISVMNEMPSDRLPIKNCVVNTGYRKKAYSFMQKEIEAGRQVYIICPMVEKGEGDMESLENVVEYTEKIKQYFDSRIRIAALHGQMKPKEKNEIMDKFAKKEIDILVSTTVIEVGINVPNATVMMIENSERFGLAQLHQLRGRVGRGKHQSYCIFMTAKEGAIERLEVLNKSNDGFFISSEDMRLRGPGDLFGIRQSGSFQFRLGDIYQDASILKDAQTYAELVFEDYELRKEANYEGLWHYFDSILAEDIDFIGI